MSTDVHCCCLLTLKEDVVEMQQVSCSAVSVWTEIFLTRCRLSSVRSGVHVLLLLFPEQYESFVKFTQDQIMRRYGARPASCKYLKPPFCFSNNFLFSHPNDLIVATCDRSTHQHQSFCVSDVSWTRTDEIPASSHKMAALLLPPSTWFSFYLPTSPLPPFPPALNHLKPFGCHGLSSF